MQYSGVDVKILESCKDSFRLGKYKSIHGVPFDYNI
jgi:hypothetical protein